MKSNLNSLPFAFSICLVSMLLDISRSYRFPSKFPPLFVRFASRSDTIDNHARAEPGRSTPAITWYPGHIAKAERELQDYLKKVDVVIEVRDARIPQSTAHPLVPQWVGNRPLIVAVVRIDQVPSAALRDWKAYFEKHSPYYERNDISVFFVDGKNGQGVHGLKREALKCSTAVNIKRKRLGIQPRAVRAAVIGFPNVGKSALINKILGRRVAKSMNMPGVTRSLQWVRIGGDKALDTTKESEIELLDSPGIIPAKHLDQDCAMKLAICNDIGEASYDRTLAAAAMCDRLIDIHKSKPSYVNMEAIKTRYSIEFDEMDGDEIVEAISEKYCQGNNIGAADKLLSDFRSGSLGKASLERPPGRLYNKPPEVERVYSKEGDEHGEINKIDSAWSAKHKGSMLKSPPDGRGEFDGW
jgi:ribosome biogenesis GTPase A